MLGCLGCLGGYQNGSLQRPRHLPAATFAFSSSNQFCTTMKLGGGVCVPPAPSLNTRNRWPSCDTSYVRQATVVAYDVVDTVADGPARNVDPVLSTGTAVRWLAPARSRRCRSAHSLRAAAPLLIPQRPGMIHQHAAHSWSCATASGKTLIATLRPKFHIARAIDLAHAAGAKRRDNLVLPELRA